MKLSAGSIKIWADLEKLFLACFFEDDTKISVQLFLKPSKRKESPLNFLLRGFGACHSIVSAERPSLH